MLGVGHDTVLNWEHSRSYPSMKKLLLLKEHLDLDPSELIEFQDGFSDLQRLIINYITENGKITVKEAQNLLGVKRQSAQSNLYFLYEL